MKRSGFRPGYHPTPAQLGELKILDKKKRNYVDKRGNVFSSRAVQEARNGYIGIEDARDLRRKQGWGDILSWKKRKELPISVPMFARQWEDKNEQPKGSAFKSEKFKKALKRAIQLATREDVPDEEFYEEADQFLEDNFDMSYEELTYYH